MSRNGQINLIFWVVAAVTVSCVPYGHATQHPPEIKVERKAVYLPAGKRQNPFNVTRHLIRLGDIQSGGPPKDGIPALDHPLFTSAAEGDQVLKSSDPILGLEFDGVAKAYPIRILNWHEVVNDDVGHQPVLVSWCPLCGSGVVYNSVSAGQRHTFGVSGLLYKRNLLLYDHETESLWSQLGGIAETGDLAGTSLELLSATQTTWVRWKSEYPRTAVLSFNTGFRRDYSKDPYANWQMDRRLALVVQVKDSTQLYPFSELKKAGSSLADSIGGVRVIILFDSQEQTGSVRGQDGQPIPHFVAFLADARAFYPDAPIFKQR
ncbi:MAG: DUF3179 domain-containing protein [Candidatus Acidiferrales bacterium]